MKIKNNTLYEVTKNDVKNGTFHFPEGITEIGNLIYDKLSRKVICFVIVVLFASGQILNIFSPHHLFYVNQMMLLIMFLIQLIILNEIKTENKEIKRCIRSKNEKDVLGLFVGKMERVSSSIMGKIISFALVVLYITTMFAVGCLEMTVTGVYGGILGGLVFYIGIQAYIHYIALLYFACNLKHTRIEHYSSYFPALTDWIRKLAHEFSYIEKWFLVLGFMYSAVYAINLPKNTISIKEGITINSDCNVLLVVTWVGILLLFAIAFPAFAFLSRTYIKNVISNCKCDSINNIKKQLFVLSKHPTAEDFMLIERLIFLVKTVSESDEYPLKYS